MASNIPLRNSEGKKKTLPIPYMLAFWICFQCFTVMKAFFHKALSGFQTFIRTGVEVLGYKIYALHTLNTYCQTAFQNRSIYIPFIWAHRLQPLCLTLASIEHCCCFFFCLLCFFVVFGNLKACVGKPGKAREQKALFSVHSEKPNWFIFPLIFCNAELFWTGDLRNHFGSTSGASAGSEWGGQTRDVCGLPCSGVPDGLPLHNILQKSAFCSSLISSQNGGGRGWQTRLWLGQLQRVTLWGWVQRESWWLQGRAQLRGRKSRANLPARSGSKTAFEGLFCYFKFTFLSPGNLAFCPGIKGQGMCACSL